MVHLTLTNISARPKCVPAQGRHFSCTIIFPCRCCSTFESAHQFWWQIMQHVVSGCAGHLANLGLCVCRREEPLQMLCLESKVSSRPKKYDIISERFDPWNVEQPTLKCCREWSGMENSDLLIYFSLALFIGCFRGSWWAKGHCF